MFGLMAPLAGIRVVEAALGVSVVGAGLASSLPGSLLRDLGADVARVQSRTRSALDQNIELLVAARAGLLSQIRAHRPGPAFADLAIAGAGAGLSAAVGALSLLYQREGTGQGGWAETSLYDGITALLPMIIGRVEHHSPTTKLLWQNRGPSEALSYRCADGEYVQLWFGAKGAFDAFLAHIGDPPSERGYNAELMSDAMVEAGQGCAGQPPTYLVWGAIDAAGGWMSACGILAGLYARRSRGGGQSVSASLLGAALTLKSGAFIAAGEVVGGPSSTPARPATAPPTASTRAPTAPGSPSRSPTSKPGAACCPWCTSPNSQIQPHRSERTGATLNRKSSSSRRRSAPGRPPPGSRRCAPRACRSSRSPPPTGRASPQGSPTTRSTASSAGWSATAGAITARCASRPSRPGSARGRRPRRWPGSPD